MNSRTKDAIVTLRALRLKFEERYPSHAQSRLMLSDIFDRPPMEARVLLIAALEQYGDRAAEEIRRELGEELDGVATVHSTTLRAATNDGQGPSMDALPLPVRADIFNAHQHAKENWQKAETPREQTRMGVQCERLKALCDYADLGALSEEQRKEGADRLHADLAALEGPSDCAPTGEQMGDLA